MTITKKVHPDNKHEPRPTQSMNAMTEITEVTPHTNASPTVMMSPRNQAIVAPEKVPVHLNQLANLNGLLVISD